MYYLSGIICLLSAVLCTYFESAFPMATYSTATGTRFGWIFIVMFILLSVFSFYKHFTSEK